MFVCCFFYSWIYRTLIIRIRISRWSVPTYCTGTRLIRCWNKRIWYGRRDLHHQQTVCIIFIYYCCVIFPIYFSFSLIRILFFYFYICFIFMHYSPFLSVTTWNSSFVVGAIFWVAEMVKYIYVFIYKVGHGYSFTRMEIIYSYFQESEERSCRFMNAQFMRKTS